MLKKNYQSSLRPISSRLILFVISVILVILSFILIPSPCASSQKLEIKARPAKYGAYIYRNGKFIPLNKAEVNFSGMTYGTSLAFTPLAACYINLKEIAKARDYESSDLLALYFPNASKRSWFYSPLSYYPRASFEGSTEAEIDLRPEGYYAGFVAIGNDGELSKLLGGYHSHGYHYECKRLGYNHIVYTSGNIVFARILPKYDIPLADYVITDNNFSFGAASGAKRPEVQIPNSGYIVTLPVVKNKKFFQAEHDRLERFNEEYSTKYLLEEKEFLLSDNSIVKTGIFLRDTAYVRFLSERNFRLVLEPREWDINGFRPFRGGFREDFIEIPNSTQKAHRVQFRDFSLRYHSTDKGTEVRLQAIKIGTKVKIIYSPSYCRSQEWWQHTDKGWQNEKNGNFETAIREFETALKMSHSNPDALNALAWLYATTKEQAFRNDKKALELALEAGRIRPEKAYILDTISAAYFVNGDLYKAIEYEEKAYGGWYNKPDNYKNNMAKYNRIKSYIKKANEHEADEMYEEAIGSIQKALNEMPNCFSAYNALAWLYATAKDSAVRSCELALKNAQIAHDLSPEEPNILDTLAEAYFLCGDSSKAIQYEEKALYWKPGNEFYIKQLRKFQAK